MTPHERDALMSPTSEQDARQSRGNLVSLILRVGTLLGLALVIGRVVQLQVSPSDQLEGFIAARQTSQSLNSVRGDLLDRRGRVLATTRIGYRVIIDPVALDNARKNNPTAVDQVIIGLSQVLDLPAEQVAQRVITKLISNEEIRASANSSTRSEQDQSVNASLATMGVSSQPVQSRVARVSRYLPIGSVIDQDRTREMRKRIKSGELPGVTLEHTQVRVQTSEPLIGSVVGKYGFEEKASSRSGILGAEKIFEHRLEGDDGSLTYVRDSDGNPLWVQRGAWVDSDKGKDVRLSIDLEMQRMVHAQLLRGVEDADAAGGRAMVINPNTGEILAMVDVLRDLPGVEPLEWWDPKSETPRPKMLPVEDQPRYKVLNDDINRTIEPALAHNRCLQDVYEPGSTFKTFVWTLAKSNGLLPDDEVLDITEKAVRTEYGRRVEDVYTYPDLNNWDRVLRYSSNIGMWMATSRLTYPELRSMVKALGFGETTGIGLSGEASGIVRSKESWDKYTQTSVGMGYAVAVTPIQMVRAFSVFARKGELAGTLPELRLTAQGDLSQRGVVGEEIVIERVFSAEAAQRTIEPMMEVARSMDKHKARNFPDDPEPKYEMYGKSGTSQISIVPPPGMVRPSGAKAYYEKQHYSSFIVAAPAQDPEIVVLVVIDDVGPEIVAKKAHYGSRVAGPVVRRVVEDVLPYLGIEPEL
ncbi:MAG: penicillin-binding protein 2 [Phycisphaerales bacterium]|nr:penicillin-binding protein 2 [Phycisphaerales bacterium]